MRRGFYVHVQGSWNPTHCLNVLGVRVGNVLGEEGENVLRNGGWNVLGIEDVHGCAIRFIGCFDLG